MIYHVLSGGYPEKVYIVLGVIQTIDMEQKNRPGRRFYPVERPKDTVSGSAGRLLQGHNLSPQNPNLKHALTLQNQTVRHYLHSIMSPLSAVSGYLDLLDNHLGQSTNPSKLERYSDKIADGLEEVSELLNQLHQICKPKEPDNHAITSPSIPEMNLLAREMVDTLNRSNDLNARMVFCFSDDVPIHLEADELQVKLLLYKLIHCTDRFATSRSDILVRTQSIGSELQLTVCCLGETVNMEQASTLLHFGPEQVDDDIISTNIQACHRICSRFKGEIHFSIPERKTPEFTLNAPLFAETEDELELQIS